MTAQEINQKITEGSKEYGSRNAYLASAEYRALYRAYKSTPVKKAARVVEIVEVPHMGRGYFLRLGKNQYVAQLGDGIGAGAGAVSFGSMEQAQTYCRKHRINF